MPGAPKHMFKDVHYSSIYNPGNTKDIKMPVTRAKLDCEGLVPQQKQGWSVCADMRCP